LKIGILNLLACPVGSMRPYQGYLMLGICPKGTPTFVPYGIEGLILIMICSNMEFGKLKEPRECLPARRSDGEFGDRFTLIYYQEVENT